MTNEEYQKIRDAFIPYAELMTNQEISPDKYPMKATYQREWDRRFMGNMDKLCRKAGLIWKR